MAVTGFRGRGVTAITPQPPPAPVLDEGRAAGAVNNNRQAHQEDLVALGCMRGQPKAVARIRTVAGARGPEEESKKEWTSADVSAGAFEQ